MTLRRVTFADGYHRSVTSDHQGGERGVARRTVSLTTIRPRDERASAGRLEHRARHAACRSFSVRYAHSGMQRSGRRAGQACRSLMSLGWRSARIAQIDQFSNVQGGAHDAYVVKGVQDMASTPRGEPYHGGEPAGRWQRSVTVWRARCTLCTGAIAWGIAFLLDDVHSVWVSSPTDAPHRAGQCARQCGCRTLRASGGRSST